MLPGKLNPPRLRYVSERPRLLRLATPAERQKLVLICAGAGFGKTTLMAQLARYYPGRYVWYQIDNLDRDPAVFLRHLIMGVSHACEGVGERSTARLAESSNAGEEGASVLAVLAEELKDKLETPLAICFDDFHFFDGVDFAAPLVDSLITDLPHQCTVYINSRTVPALQMGRMRSQGTVLELGAEDLQFSLDELKELMSDTWNLQVDEETFSQLHKNTEGWPAGLVLMEEHLRSGNEVPEIICGTKIRRKVYEYLAEEVLNRQSEDLQRLLETSALINPVDPAICQTALGFTDAPALLSTAEKMNLFTSRLGDSDLYRYHPLFREFLLARLREKLSSSEVEDLRSHLGAAFEAAGNVKKAVEQYLKSGKHDKAIPLMEDLGEEMLNNGEYITLERWFSHFEGPLPQALEIYRGRLLLLAGKPYEALNRLRAVKERLDSSEINSICETSAAISECFCMLGERQEGISEIVPMLKLRLPAEVRFNLLHRLSSCYWDSKDLKGIKFCVREAKKIAQETSSPSLLCKVQAMIAGDCLKNGEFPEAERLLSSVANSDIEAASKNLYLNNLASCKMMLGKYEIANKLSDQCMTTIKQQREEKWLPLVYDTYGCSLVALGDWQRGEKYVKKAISLIDEKGLNRAESCAAKCHLGTFARRRGEYNSAIDIHSESLNIASESMAYYDTAMITINLGADLSRAERYQEAEAKFVEATELSKERNFKYALTHIDFHRAWLFHQKGNSDLEIEYLSCALKRANKYQHNHFIIQEGQIALPLFATAIANKIETAYVMWVLERLGSSALSVIEMLISSDEKDVRARCAKLLTTINNPKAISLARKLMRDADREVRGLAQSAMNILRDQIDELDEVLTKRETQIIEMISAGLSNSQIASQLFISERTVKTHVTNIFRKLGLKSRLEAALYFQKSADKDTH